MRTILLNHSLITSLIATVLAQFVKVPIHYIAKGDWDWRKLLASGGMPSSHSATVSCLAASLGITHGFESPIFGIAAILGLIVMYDAAGIRRHAGETAMALNRLEAEFDKHIEEEYKGKTRLDFTRRHKRLKEMLGHQPAEVVAGAVFGVVVALVFQRFWY
ncbi:divergent PAP2 family protein [Effusibacillus pohliae]|uniref:divergent PAP2 family protein n=1 Tax=Effusibacillus pohliae TaxID=232270 RepID=UPI00035D8D39|nr:divergent PAP2 family protein [Effusibacillus pohliae]